MEGEEQCAGETSRLCCCEGFNPIPQCDPRELMASLPYIQVRNEMMRIQDHAAAQRAQV